LAVTIFFSFYYYLSEHLLKADHSPPLDCGPARAARVFG
jgi:hypothetical protein